MKAFLLAAGKGERLRPLTDATPKCMVPIQDIPLLKIWLELCRQHGIAEVLVNTHAHAGMVQNYLKGQRAGIKIHVTREDVLLGSAGTVLANRDWAASERDFWIFYSDVLTNANLTAMLEFHRRKDQAATMGVYEVAHPRQCGIVTVDSENIVQEFAEKPLNPRGNLAFSGILLATPAMFDLIPHRVPADIGFHVLPRLVGRVAAYPISEYLVDVGSPSSYKKAQQTWPGLGVHASVS
jgi:mannose-1-phosphate guanylyltransferase